MKLKSMLLIVVSAFALIGIIECRSFAQEKKVVINIQELGTKIGVPGEEMELPNGQKRLRQTWRVEDVEKVISGLQYCFDSPEATYLITEVAEPWMTLALLDALRPLKVKYLYPNPSIGTELAMHDLKRGEQNPNYDVRFEVFQDGDNVYINLTSDRSDAKEKGHTFDLENLSKVAIPEIPAGKHVFIHAKGMYGVMVCIANNYVKDAKSLSIGCHESDYICAVSKTDGLKMGDVTPRKMENNL
jgi:hypothetical protein